MLLTVSRLGGPPQLLYSSSMVWANSGSGAMLDLHTHIVPPRWEDFGWARRGVGVREDALSACRHFRRQSAPRARSLTAPRAPVHYSSRWPGPRGCSTEAKAPHRPGPTRPRTSAPGPPRADRAFVFPKRHGDGSQERGARGRRVLVLPTLWPARLGAWAPDGGDGYDPDEFRGWGQSTL